MSEPRTKAGQKMLYDMGLDDPIVGKHRRDTAIRRIRAIEKEAAGVTLDPRPETFACSCGHDEADHYSRCFHDECECEVERYALDPRPAPDTALREALAHLYQRGYQSIYNGRPSCPFCSHFIDTEDTHSQGCALRAALENTP